MHFRNQLAALPQSMSKLVTLALSVTVLVGIGIAQQGPSHRGISQRRLDDIATAAPIDRAKPLLRAHNTSGGSIRYRTVQIGVLPGYTNSEIANEVNIINNAGHVAGYSWIYNGDITNLYLTAHPFLWKEGKLTPLPLPKGASAAFATGINNRDQVIAETNEVDSTGAHIRRAFMVDQGEVAVLPALDADSNTQPFAVNVWGSVVGRNQNRTNGQNTPVMWSGGKIYALPLLPGQDEGFAFGINDFGAIAGYQFPADDSSETACLWYWNGHSYSIIALSTLGGNYGDAFGINNWGQVTGNATDAGDVNFFGTLWDYRGVHELPMLPGDTDGIGNAINDFGGITGFTYGVDKFGNEYQRVVLWSNHTVTDLQTVVPASTPPLSNIGNANLSGQIAVEAGSPFDGSEAAYVLIPNEN
jgi:uncharacterized membrane protein